MIASYTLRNSFLNRIETMRDFGVHMEQELQYKEQVDEDL